MYAVSSSTPLNIYDSSSSVGEVWPTSSSATKWGMLSATGDTSVQDSRLADQNGQPALDGNGDMFIPSCGSGLNHYRPTTSGLSWQRTIQTPSGGAFRYAEGRRNNNGNFTFIIAIDCAVPGSVWKIDVSEILFFCTTLMLGVGLTCTLICILACLRPFLP